MTLKHILHKKSAIQHTADSHVESKAAQTFVHPPEFKFVRSTTTTEEVIEPPAHPADPPSRRRDGSRSPPGHAISVDKTRRRPSFFRKKSGQEHAPPQNNVSPPNDAPHVTDHDKRTDRKLSDRLRTSMSITVHKRTSRDSISPNLPDDLGRAPESVSSPMTIPLSPTAPTLASPTAAEAQQSREAEWEKRATRLALTRQVSSSARSPSLRSKSPAASDTLTSAPQSRQVSATSEFTDQLLQRAITLHEQGDLTNATFLFAQLADEHGPNIPLAQVLYGLSLRHGWGTSIDLERGMHHLALAAQTSATIEADALNSGLARGGSAKGELTIAIFELANCFRYGWGVECDTVAARTYYETAANLGDLDAVEELANCLLNGIGGPKDKVGCGLNVKDYR